MSDPRVELAELTGGGDEATVLTLLDSVQVVIEVSEGRCRSRADQAALFNLVNLVARLHGHVEIRVPPSVPCDLRPFAEGDLGESLTALAADLSPEPVGAPTSIFHLAWARTPSGPGLSGDGAGWNYSVSPEHLPLKPDPGPPVGGLAATCFMAAQLFARVLGPAGLPHHPTEGFVASLLDYRAAPAESPGNAAEPALPPSAWFGCGSVGSSALYAALLCGLSGGGVDLVDPDKFSARNTLRYPVLRELATDGKSTWLEALAERGGIAATGHATDVNGYLNSFEQAPAIDLALVSVDTLDGRRDATDVLARTTLSVGVAGLSLHTSRHGFAEDSACAYCGYVDVEPALSGAQVLANMIGLPVERVIALELGDGRITEADAQMLAAGGRFADAPRVGDRLADVRRRIYAQAAVPTPGGDVLVSAPFVSAIAGVLLIAEAIKAGDPALNPFRLSGRYDLDMTGEPADATVATPRDPSGRCLCHSGFRRRAYQELHGDRGANQAA